MMKIRNTAMICVAMLLGLLAASCSKKESVDARGLLAAVPSDASMVTVVNIKAIIEDTGSKTDGAKVEASEELESSLLRMSDADKAGKLKALLDGGSGVELSCAILFMEGADVYAHGTLADPDAFRAMVEKNSGEKFSTAEGVEVCGNTAVDGDRFWVRLTHRNSIESNQVKRFTGLDKSQSILSASGIDALADTQHDMAGWANVSALINASAAGFSQKAMARMALGALFDDAQSIIFDADFEKGELAFNASVLDSKGKHAKFLYPLDKIDTGTVASLGGSGSLITAAALSEKTVGKFRKDAGDNSVSEMRMYAQLLSCVDGTAAVLAASEQNGIKGVITTTGKDTGDLQNALSAFGLSVTMDGKKLLFSQGTTSGDLTAKDAAPKFKDAAFGLVMDNPGAGKEMSWAKTCSMMFKPDGNSIRAEVRLAGGSPDENILVTILRALL